MTQPRAGRREWTALAVLTLPLLIVSMDVSVLFFAVPHIAETLQPSATQLLWIFDIYGFVLAGLLLTMGNVADRIGRRRLLLIGATAFGGASVLAAFAPTAEALIFARALLGVGGATLMPSTLAIIRSMFQDDRERAKAVGIWSAVLAGGVGLGPVVSGFLLEHFWWGSVFLINVPFMLMLLVLAPILVPESRSSSVRVDLVTRASPSRPSFPRSMPSRRSPSMAPRARWPSPRRSVSWQARRSSGARLRVRSPMVDLALFRVRGFGGSIAIQVIGMFGVMGNAILMTQYLQSVLGLSPLTAALWSLAPSVAVGAAAPLSVALSTRFGRPPVIAGAFLLAAIGFVAMRFAGVGSPIWPAIIASALIAVGLVAVVTIATEYAVGLAPTERAGSVSALVETASEFGGALGMAVLGSIVSAAYAARIVELLPAGLPSQAVAAAGETLGEATVVAAQLGGSVGDVLLLAARTAYVDAMHVDRHRRCRAAHPRSAGGRPSPAARGELSEDGPARTGRERELGAVDSLCRDPRPSLSRPGQKPGSRSASDGSVDVRWDLQNSSRPPSGDVTLARGELAAATLPHARWKGPQRGAVLSMQTRWLGKLWPVSSLTLGGGGIGQVWGATSRHEAVATVREAVDRGINLLDVAPTYGDGEAERVVGEAFQGRLPDGVRIVTKHLLGNPPAEEVATKFEKSLADSLRRMRLSYVDLYVLHGYLVNDDEDGGIELTPRSLFVDAVRPAFERLVAEGRIGAWGITGMAVPSAVLATLDEDPAPGAVQAITNLLDSPGDIRVGDEPPRLRAIVTSGCARRVGVMGIRAVQAGALHGSDRSRSGRRSPAIPRIQARRRLPIAGCRGRRVRGVARTPVCPVDARRGHRRHRREESGRAPGMPGG